jgi:CxxC motif-containing protein
VPCRTTVPFPREKVQDLLRAIYGQKVQLPVRRGQVLIADALGSGIDVIATRSIS